MTNPITRFKKDDGSKYPDWLAMTVNDCFSKIKDKNKTLSCSNVITNSAEYGLISQRDFFDKDIAVEGKTSNYTLIRGGDFVYNPRKSTQAPYGPFKRYDMQEEGIVSPLYTCLRPKGVISSDYLEWYFSTSAWHRYIYENGAQGGARHDRVGMTNELLKNIPVRYPPDEEEQQKIAALFNELDNLIDATADEVSALEDMKKGMMQKIFSQEIRFKKDDGSEYPEWEEEVLSKRATFYNGDRGKNYPSTSDYVPEGIPFINAGDLDGLHVSNECAHISPEKYNQLGGAKLKRHDILYCLRGSLGKKGIVEFDGGGTVASSLLAIRAKDINYKYLFCFLDSNLETKQRRLHDEGAAQPNLSARNVGNYVLPVPDPEEQHKIADFFSAMDDAISAAKDEMAGYKDLKKALLQQMFV